MSDRWYQQAKCRLVDPAIFFPDKHANAHTIKSAKQVCARCPVISECLAYALTADVEGVWGGTVQRERNRMRRGMDRRPRRSGVRGDGWMNRRT